MPFRFHIELCVYLISVIIIVVYTMVSIFDSISTIYIYGYDDYIYIATILPVDSILSNILTIYIGILSDRF